MALYRIEEEELSEKKLIGNQCENAINDIKHLIDIVFGNGGKNNNIDYDFFDIKGTVLLHGIAGVGKTTIAKNCMTYALDMYGVESYALNASDIIVSGLGESVKNLHDALSEFDELEEGILFIDEIDKFFVNRESVAELSELKRLVIEFMGYIDSLAVHNKKILIGCTNIYDQIDEALRRRFSINEEIVPPSAEEKNEFFEVCLRNIGSELSDVQLRDEYLSHFETMDAIKAYFRRHLLDASLDVLVKEIQNNHR